VAGKPILAHLLDPLTALDPDEVVFVVGYRGEQIKEYVGANYDFKARYVRQEELLGLGFALNLAFEGMTDTDVLIILGDTIVDCDLPGFVAAGDYVLGLRQVDDPKRFGIAEVSDNIVNRVEEKPEEPHGNLAIIGLYYFKEIDRVKRALSDHIAKGTRTRGEIQFTDALQNMITDGVKFAAFEVEGWFDCGKKETMLATNRRLLSKMDEKPSGENTVIVPPVHIAPSARVVDSVIGPNVSISENSVVEKSVIAETIIGAGSRLSRVVIRDSLVGHDVVIQGDERQMNIGDSSQFGVD
jgi:glucose-1-phosphate thymidylyltransferase